MKKLLALLAFALLAPVYAAEPPPEPEAPPAFVEYVVEGVGTVLEPQGVSGYRVRLPSGAVVAYLAQSGNPCEANAAADIAYARANPPPAPVPTSVTRRQLLLALNQAGVTRAAIRATLTAIEDPTAREAALIEFDEAATFDRTHALVAQLASVLGLTSAQVDAIYRNAATL
ncbi:MAG TPA: hypothetical protein VLH79_06795 [Chthonomonadales bacterium]|nr:hypothetical protein [Chthonomonadales bacterium]